MLKFPPNLIIISKYKANKLRSKDKSEVVFRDDINHNIKIDQAEIERVGLKLLCKQSPVSLITNVTIASIMLALLWPVVTSSVLFLWFSCVVITLGLRWFLANKLYHTLTNKAYSQSRIKHKLFTYNISLSLNGLTWGSLGLLIDSNWPLNQQIVIPMVMAGLCAGAISTYINNLKSYFSFIVPVILPLCYGLYTANLALISLTILVYLIAMIFIVKRLNASVVESFRLRLLNTELVDNLTNVNHQQTELLLEIKKKEAFLQQAFDGAGVSMILINKEQKIINANYAACRLSGYNKTELLKMRALDLFHEDDREKGTPFLIELIAGQIDRYQVKKRFVNKQGNILWVNSTISSVKYDNNKFDYAVVQSQDITQEQVLTQHLTYQAKHDSLTGLANRYAFDEKLQQVIIEYNDHNKPHVLCYIDLDQFKIINDTCGHLAGDELLRQISEVIRNSVRESDFLARIGGDEFAILMLNCSLSVAERSLTNLLQSICEFQFIHNGQVFTIGASLGVTVIEHHSETYIEVMKRADSACYAAKEAGRNQIHIFDGNNEDIKARHHEMQWVSLIQKALKNNSFVLYSQEVVSLSSAEQRPHYELLIRLINDDGTIVAPGEFLPSAERYNQAPEIDLWVVNKVISTLKEARVQGRDIDGQYNINISGASLGTIKFDMELISLIRENDWLGQYLCFEITETATIANLLKAQSLMKELRELGCQFALDDFGSGLSSFSYLKQLPIDYLKIDGIFVKDCLTDPVNLAMIQSFHDISKVMGVKTVAEYVETEAIFNKMQKIGIDYVQGHWKSKPIPWHIN